MSQEELLYLLCISQDHDIKHCSKNGNEMSFLKGLEGKNWKQENLRNAFTVSGILSAMLMPPPYFSSWNSIARILTVCFIWIFWVGR